MPFERQVLSLKLIVQVSSICTITIKKNKWRFIITLLLIYWQPSTGTWNINWLLITFKNNHFFLEFYIYRETALTTSSVICVKTLLTVDKFRQWGAASFVMGNENKCSGSWLNGGCFCMNCMNLQKNKINGIQQFLISMSNDAIFKVYFYFCPFFFFLFAVIQILP